MNTPKYQISQENLWIKIKDRLADLSRPQGLLNIGLPIFPKIEHSNISGVLVTLLWEFGNMRSDHVIYLPSSQNATNDRRKISKRSLRDTFILDRLCLGIKPDKG